MNQIQEFLNEVESINIIDVGSSGFLSDFFKPIYHKLNLIGFEPNSEECERLNQLNLPYKSWKFLPYALGSKTGLQKLYKTESIYNYSLLKPNTEWLNRFSYSDLFKITGEIEVDTYRISDIKELNLIDVDIIKIDSQGLDRDILMEGEKLLSNTIMIEAEPGFVDNYLNENTFSDLDFYFKKFHFHLFDLNLHRVGRSNALSKYYQNEEVLWAESIWLYDFIESSKHNLTREKAIKALILSALQGSISFGLEQAYYFEKLGLIKKAEIANLENSNHWLIDPLQMDVKPSNKTLNWIFRLLPTKTRKFLSKELETSSKQKHIFRRS